MFHQQRATGLWTFDSVITGAELAYWDEHFANAIDGAGGGAYALSAPLVIGGGVGTYFEVDIFTEFTASVICNDTFAVGGAADFGAAVHFHDGIVTMGATSADALEVNAFATFHSTVIFDDDVSFETAATFVGTATHTGATIFNGGATFNGFLNADGNCFLGSSTGFVEFLGDVTARTAIGFADNGKVSWRTQIISAPGNQSIVAAHVDTVFIPDNIVANGDNITIDDTGAKNGMRVHFKTRDNANTVYIRRPGGASIGTGLVVGVGTATWLTVERIAGVWELIATGQGDT